MTWCECWWLGWLCFSNLSSWFPKFTIFQVTDRSLVGSLEFLFQIHGEDLTPHWKSEKVAILEVINKSIIYQLLEDLTNNKKTTNKGPQLRSGKITECWLPPKFCGKFSFPNLANSKLPSLFCNTELSPKM